MNPQQLARRHFLQTSACGLGSIALADLLAREGLTADAEPTAASPLAPRATHFAPRAKRVIFLFMAGGPSHLDLFDPKPAMKELHGKPVPQSFLDNLDDK